MKHALIHLTVAQFRPLGGAFPISATFALPDASPGISMHNGDIIVKGDHPAHLVFHMTNPAYVFIGAAFDSKTHDADVGTREFPHVTINRSSGHDLPSNCLSIMDAKIDPEFRRTYSYVLLIQNTLTAEIGIVDPSIINEPRI